MKFFQPWKKDSKDAPVKLPGQRALLTALSDHFLEAAGDINQSLEDTACKIMVSKPVKTKERAGGLTSEVHRVIVQNSSHGLSIKAVADDLVEAYMMPASQLVLVPQTEYPSRQKFKLSRQAGNEWWLDGRPVSDSELRMLVLTITNDLLKHTREGGTGVAVSEGGRIRIGELSLTTGLRDLLFEKAQLVSDLVTQQERLQSQLAGDLHDSVIADLLFLKRELSAGKQIPQEKICTAIDEVVTNLRDICADLSSREIRDWGLKHALVELAERLSERGGQQITVDADAVPDDFPDEAALQIYRITQELLNNAIKHAQCRNIGVNVSCGFPNFRMTIVDDGVGFSVIPTKNSRQGGMGIPLLKERAEMLTTLGLPASLSIDSQPGKGTQVILQVDISRMRPRQD